VTSYMHYFPVRNTRVSQQVNQRVSSSPSLSCLGPVGAGNVNFLHQINNLCLPVTPSYNRQFEINSSTVNIYNYSIMNPLDWSDNL
jgi:ABC-type phosphate transport system ATPase subunit